MVSSSPQWLTVVVRIEPRDYLVLTGASCFVMYLKNHVQNQIMTRLKHRESKKVCIEIRGAYCMGKLGIRVGKSIDLRLSI